ncbi:hypothetical protein ACN42_g7712 [Penicillium freii]|uniref:Major facilitator superfamily (MFS) profile domain-containing protein n=1 Tax=Penicillium freii TaxID=48697 RepID=A0A124GQX0_PENFR|nr:hypothetical protein ACN42_g7712 [Penicillium freii]
MSTTERQSEGLGSEQSSQLEKQDAVDWDGPDDPANPLNWSQAKKNMHVIFVSVFTLYANLAATMFAPGAEQLVSEFHIANSTIEAMTVSIYVLGFAVGPLNLAPLSEVSNLKAQVIGPVIGGFVTETIGWRWTFRIILIMSGVFSIISLIFLRETNAKVLMQRKAANVPEKPTTAAAPLDRESPGKMLRAAIIRHAKMLVFSPIVLLISLYSGALFGVIFLLFTTLPTLFESQYHFDIGLAGLAYQGLGLGMIIGLVLFAILSDKLLGQKRGGTVNRPEERLILMKWFAPITPVGCFYLRMERILSCPLDGSYCGYFCDRTWSFVHRHASSGLLGGFLWG